MGWFVDALGVVGDEDGMLQLQNDDDDVDGNGQDGNR